MTVGLSVKDFGAIGDGVTDDTAAFQATYDALPFVINQAGGAIYVPAGDYVVNNWRWTLGGKTVALYGEYGRSYIHPKGDAWALIVEQGANALPLWARHSIRDICFDGDVGNEGNGVAHGAESGIDYERVRFTRLKIGVQMNSSSYGDMHNVFFRQNQIGMLVSGRTGATTDPETVLAFPPPTVFTNNANKQFRHLTFILNRISLLFDTEFSGAIRHSYWGCSFESSVSAVVVLPPGNNQAPFVDLHFDRGHFEGNGPKGGAPTQATVFGQTINQGDISAYHGRVHLTNYQALTTATADGDTDLIVNDTQLYVPAADSYYVQTNGGQIRSTDTIYGGGSASYRQAWNFVGLTSSIKRTSWRRPLAHTIKTPYARVLISIDGSNLENPLGVIPNGLGGLGATETFNESGGPFGSHQQLIMPSENNNGYTIDFSIVEPPIEGSYYFLLLTVKADVKGALVRVIAGDLFSGFSEIDEEYRTYIWMSQYNNNSPSFILNYNSAAQYDIGGMVLGRCVSSAQVQELLISNSHPELF